MPKKRSPDEPKRKPGRPRNPLRRFKAEEKAWNGMQSRCEDTSRDNYHRYGGRGITVCERWRASFANFLADVGPKPDPSWNLGRINNDGHYEPGNVRWESAKANHRNKVSNRAVTLLGRTQTLIEWAEEIGIRKQTLRWRIDNWSEEDVVHKKVRSYPGPRANWKGSR